jgi:hypothetical protein
MEALSQDEQAAVVSNSVQDRRLAARLPWSQQVSLASVTGIGNAPWHGHGRDLSSVGFSAVLARRFERGTLLSATLQGESAAERVTSLAQVTRVLAMNTGTWLLGCQFTTPLDPEEFQSVVESRHQVEESPTQQENSVAKDDTRVRIPLRQRIEALVRQPPC